MLNIEKYKDEIIEEALDDEFCSIAKLAQGDPCCFHQKDNCEDCVLNTIEWLLGEYKEPILDEAEKKYLSAVIKPFRSRVKYIRKCISHDEFEQRIQIVFYNGYFTYLPYFKANTMYKGMETDKDYTLKELVL